MTAMLTRLLVFSIALGAGATASAAVFDFDPDPARSKIEVDVKATVGSFVGALTAYEADFRLDDESREVMRGEIRFDFKDLETGEEKRNHHMWEWMGYDAHPRGRFVLEQILETEAGAIAVGTLEAAGVQKAVRIPVTIERGDDSASVDGRLTVDHRDYGLGIIRMMWLIKVNPVFDVIFHLEGPLKPTTHQTE